MMQDMQAQVDLLIAAKPWIGIWLNWMTFVLVLSVIFGWKHKAARWVFLSTIAIVPTSIGIFHTTQNIHFIGIAHIIFWIPLTYYLLQHEVRTQNFSAKSCYGIWLIALLCTICISLVFDVYDVIFATLGWK